jgi:hypothetical protein
MVTVIAVNAQRLMPPGMSPGQRRHLRMLASLPRFRRLFAARLFGQFADGVFQLSLAGAVLFNPERQARAADVAAGFVVLLLPYSVIGPFAGVLLDRWWRQRVLVWTSALRAVAVLLICPEIAAGVHGMPFYASALVVISISRFFLSALSAALPHVVGADELVTANSLSTTVGALATTAGGAVAVGVRGLFGGASPGAYAVIAAAAAVPYAAAAIAAHGFERRSLGPDEVRRAHRETFGDVAHGLVAGAKHLYSRRPAFLALCAIGVHRLCYGLFAVCSVLLYRNYYTAQGPFRVGLGGLAQFVIALAIGGALASVVTPPVSRRIGYAPTSALLLAGSGIVQLALVLPYRLPLLVLAAVLFGFCAQGIKICVDTVVQREVDDQYRGRVFALYDVLFNLALVAAAVLTALVLPPDGRSPAAVVVIGLAYLATAVGYSWLSRERGVPAAAPTSG